MLYRTLKLGRIRQINKGQYSTPFESVLRVSTCGVAQVNLRLSFMMILREFVCLLK